MYFLPARIIFAECFAALFVDPRAQQTINKLHNLYLRTSTGFNESIVEIRASGSCLYLNLTPIARRGIFRVVPLFDCALIFVERLYLKAVAGRWLVQLLKST